MKSFTKKNELPDMLNLKTLENVWNMILLISTQLTLYIILLKFD